MMEQNDMEKESPRSHTDYAGRCGLLIGVMWIISFVCSARSLSTPLLGYAGNTVALLSLYALYLTVVRYRAFVAPLNWWGSCKMAWLTCIFAGLLTTLAQYLYFRFLDGGHLLAAMTELVHNEQYMQAMQQLMPGITPDELTRMLGSITIGDMTLNLWMFNLMLSLPMSMTAGTLAALKNVERFQQKQ